MVHAIVGRLAVLAGYIVSRMFGAFDTGFGFGMDGFSGTMGSIAQNNPVSIMGGAIAIFGGALFVAGIVIAIWLKQRSRR